MMRDETMVKKEYSIRNNNEWFINDLCSKHGTGGDKD